MGFRFLDPCDDEFSEHLAILPDGSVRPKTPAGEYMVARVQLNRPFLRSWRQEKNELLHQVDEAANLVSTTPAGTREHSTAGRILARLEHRLSSEFGDFWTARSTSPPSPG
jgi:hypothetical protein